MQLYSPYLDADKKKTINDLFSCTIFDVSVLLAGKALTTLYLSLNA